MISIIIPVYNVEKYLERCLDSVIRQTKPFDEVIIINDGSTDRSEEICKRYVSKYEYIKYYRQPNKGLSITRNRGIQLSINPWVMFLDSDDEIEENAHKDLWMIIGENKEKLDVITTNLIKKTNNKIRHIKSSSRVNYIYSGPEYLKCELKYNTYSPASTRNVYNKDFLLKHNILFEPQLLHEDELYSILVFLKAENVFVSDLIFYIHHIREGSITQNKDMSNNAISINRICSLLEPILNKISDKKMRKYISKHFVNLSFYRFKLAMKNNKYNSEFINKKFIIKYQSGLKNRVRTLFYRLSPKLLLFFDRPN